MVLHSVFAVAFLLCPQGEEAKDIRQRVDAYLAPLVETKIFAGSVLAAKDGKVLVERAFGKADYESGVLNTPDTRCKLMSTTKVVTAVAVMALHQSGKLHVDDPIGKHLPNWPTAWKAATIRQLLSHTAGIPNHELEWTMAARHKKEFGLSVWPEVLKRLSPKPIHPTRQSRYSNFNFILAGLLIEAVSGESYDDYLRSTVFEKAGMSHTGCDYGKRFDGLAIGYIRGPGGEPEVTQQTMSMIKGAGGLYSTVGDLYRLDRALRGEKLLTQASKKEMYRKVSDYFAVGWRITQDRGRRCIRHSGGANGYVAEYLRFPEQDVCVVVLSNLAYAPVGRIGQDLAAMAFGEDYEPPKTVDEKTLEHYAGSYRDRGGCFLLVVKSGGSLLGFEVHPKHPRCSGRILIPLGEGRFALPFGKRSLQFTADKDNTVRSADFVFDGRVVQSLRRTKMPAEAWKAAVGVYVVDGNRKVELSRGSKGLTLGLPVGHKGSLGLTPVSEDLAIGMITGGFGTLMKLERDGRGRVRAWSWHSPSGREITGRR